MHETLRKLRDRRTNDDGFTLVELLVVVVIIGVLVAIAIPVYLNYTKGAKNKSAASDLRGGIIAVEQAYTENNNVYPAAAASASAGAGFDVGTTGQKITVSSGNRVSYAPASPATSYKLCAVNEDGGKYFFYNSTQGGAVKELPASVNSMAACLALTTAP